jgi:hypothetical protein
MLARIADDQNAVLRAYLFEKSPHLPGAGEARFVQHVEMSAGRIGFLLPGKKALKSVGLDPGLAKLACRF